MTNRGQLAVAFLVVIGLPVFLAFWLVYYRWTSPFLAFLAVGAVSLLGGCVIHGLGSYPAAALGLEKLRGVKLHLLFPFAVIFLILVSREEWRGLLFSSVRWIHVFLGGGFLILFIGGYLMRSGNFPLIPVLDSERLFRDLLEEVFGARPRFKEFLIGHPLLILGLYLRSKSDGENNFFKNGRLWIWLGMVGQISILNTFVHFHSPFTVGVARMLHGLWLGFLLSIPLCYVFPMIEKALGGLYNRRNDENK